MLQLVGKIVEKLIIPGEREIEYKPKPFFPFRKTVARKTDWRCYYCGINLKGRMWHIEHKIPRSRGGTDDLDNLVPSCPECNLLKFNMTEEEFRKKYATYLWLKRKAVWLARVFGQKGI